ncbi:MAG: aminoacyl-tRNA hydrolase [Elusimicrobiota bacterium]|nr:aminoacyl-tRNA hydrolase [Elusimicrobiota bacterium]
MNKSIRLFVGLGNPGVQYEYTRHNFGFRVLDFIAKNKNLCFKSDNKFNADVSFFNHSDVKIYLIKPMSFMNLSGKALFSFMSYYKINVGEIFVFYDDFSIPLGEYKIKMQGSSGGHNGIKSLTQWLNCSAFARMKLGIGPTSKFFEMSDFVLSNFSKSDEKQISCVCKDAMLLFDNIILYGIEKAISKFDFNKHKAL